MLKSSNHRFEARFGTVFYLRSEEDKQFLHRSIC